ncbi:MAG: ankyrin repeat domain-containing protein [Legionella sp.]|nr:ankyrin repeat domain-containing protein [Legionella sp.]
MTIATDIIARRMPDFDQYIRAGDSLDDIDEYGFTPLIECAITHQLDIAKKLIELKVDINKSDVTGRTPLHWAADNDDIELVRLLLNHGANPNAYTRNGLSVLVYPVLRGQDNLKQLLYHHGAKLDFSLDFTNAKLLGHRFELKGDVDIVTAENKFIELDYEGFILEFTVAVIKDSLRRFISSYSTRHLREHFPHIHLIMDGFTDAAEMLKFQHQPVLEKGQLQRLAILLKQPMLILPAASKGHALCFIRYKQYWAKIDRGENSLKEGSVNIYKITRPEVLDIDFLQNFLYRKQSRRFFHQIINQELGLVPIMKMSIPSQIAGNCSWANVQSVVPVAYSMLDLNLDNFNEHLAMNVYQQWLEWDKDRALDECIQRFYLANPQRKASLAATLGGVLFQACDYKKKQDVDRAEKILKILSLPDYYYILKSYLQEYCVKRLTKRGNNLLKILDDCGVNPNIGVNPMATDI